MGSKCVDTQSREQCHPVGNVTQQTDRLGRQKVFSYDAGDRLTGGVWKSAAGVTVNLLTYAYDANDNLTSAADYSGALSYTFDELGRVKAHTNVFGQVLTYTRDALDRATKREDSLGGVLTSTYDAAGRLTSRQFGGSGQTPVRIDLGYAARDELSSKTWYTDLAGTAVLATSAYAYDDAGRLTGIVNKNSAAATLSYYNYGYDNADRVSVHSWWSQVGTVVYSGTNTYSYDTTSQLTDDGTSAYSYDLNGNRTMSGYQTGSANRMTNDGTFTYTYDAEGNLSQKSKGAGLETWYYGWDNANQLTSVRKASDGSTNTLLVTYTYDVEGNLVQEDKWKSGVGTTTTRHAFDGANVWADLDGSNAVQVRYVTADGLNDALSRTVASGANAGLWAYFTDNQRSTRDLVNALGQVKDNISFDGFGVVTESHSSVGDRFKHQGGEQDSDTGQTKFGARFYASNVGRWTREDPIGFRAGDANLYRFVANNATNATDPTGLVRSDQGMDESNRPLTLEEAPPVRRPSRWERIQGATLDASLQFLVGALETLVPANAQLPSKPPSPVTKAGMIARWTGRILATAGGLGLFVVGAGMTGGGAAGTLVTVGIASPVTVPVAGAGIIVMAGGAYVFVNGSWVILTKPVDYYMAAPDPPNGGSGNTGQPQQPAQPAPTGAGKPAVQNVNPFELTPTHGVNKSPAQMEALRKSIQEKGFLHNPDAPVAYVKFGEQKYLVDGHHRARIAKELGLKEIPAVEVQLPYKGYSNIWDLLGL